MNIMNGYVLNTVIGGIVVLSGGAFTLSIRHLFKEISRVDNNQNQIDKSLQNTRENYVSTPACKEDRNELKEMLKEYKEDTKAFRIEQLGTTKHIHKRLDEILKATKNRNK